MNIALKHLDKAIFATALAFKDAEARYAACADRCDVPGRVMLAEDTAELDAAMEARNEAVAILCSARPETKDGVNAILEWLATDKSLSREAANDAAANLLLCAALAV
jgi:hypothetical protein